jgi:putative oxidoreductase
VVLTGLVAQPLAVFFSPIGRLVLAKSLIHGILFALLVPVLVRHPALQLKVERFGSQAACREREAQITVSREGVLMSIFEASRSVWTGRMLSLLRIVAGALFIEHGTQKVFGWPPTNVIHVPVTLMSMLGVAGLIETFGGIAIVLGLLTRPVAFILAGEMAVAYFTAHFPRSLFPVNSGGDPAVLFCFIFLYFMFAGAGPWSLDAMIGSSGRATPPGEARRQRHAAAA